MPYVPRLAVPVLAALALLLASPAAHAVSEIQPQLAFPQKTPEPIDPITFAEWRVPVNCTEIDTESTVKTCSAEVELVALRVLPHKQWAVAPGAKPQVIAKARVELAVGATGTVSFTVPPAKLYAPMINRAKSGAKVFARTANVLDPGGVPTESWPYWAKGAAADPLCTVPSATTYRAAKPVTYLIDHDNDSKTAPKPYNPKHKRLHPFYEVRANAATTFTINGLTYAFPKNAVFTFSCVNVNAIKKGRWFPGPQLARGSVRVSGKPTGARQFAALVGGNASYIGSRNTQRVDFTVSTTKSKKMFLYDYDVVRVKRGSTITATPFLHLHKSAVCTVGAALRVQANGKITRLRR